MPHPAFRTFAQHYLAALLEESGTVYLDELIPRDPKLRVFKHPSRHNFGTAVLSEVVGEQSHILISPEVIGEAELVDLLFEPNQCPGADKLAQLGWLGQLIRCPTIIQVLRHLPSVWDMRNCLRHWLAWQTEQSGHIVPVDAPSPANEWDLDDEDEPEDEDYLEDEDCLEELNQAMLILVPSITAELLSGFGANAAPEYSRGVYRFPAAFAITVVVINQLPIEPATLWLRLLGRGPVQRQAIEALLQLGRSGDQRLEQSDQALRDRAMVQLSAWYDLLQTGQSGRESQRLLQTLSQLAY